MAIDQHPVFAVPFHGAGQHLALGVAAHGGEVFDRLAVVGARHVLLDDRTLVQIGGDVMRGGAYQFHAPVMRLVIGFGALEAGQKGVVDVDGAAGEFFAQVVRQNLHVARQHHQFGALGLDDLQLPGLDLRLGRRRDGQVMKRDVVAGRQLVELAVVGHDGAHVQRQQARLAAKQQVVQAVAFLADQDHRAHGLGGVVQFPAHLEGLGKGFQLTGQLCVRQLAAGELHAHEKQARALVVVLRGFFDVAAMLEQKAGDGMNNAPAVGA